jgi:lysophospholipase L1-like esterase
MTEAVTDRAPGRSGTASPVWPGWADRLGGILDGHAQLEGRRVEFANLAASGQLIGDVVDEQVPVALALRADLASVLVGGRDLMLQDADPDTLATELETGIAGLRAAGAAVLVAGCFDPLFSYSPGPARGRAAAYNASLWDIARTNACIVLDLWGMREFQAASMWAPDRAHLSARGHRLLASRAAHALGVPYAQTESQSTSSGAPSSPLPIRM